MWQATIWEPAGRADERRSVADEQAQLARLRRQVDERWRTLALASERATTLPANALDRLYDAYMRAVDAYVARQRGLTRPQQAQRRAS